MEVLICENFIRLSNSQLPLSTTRFGFSSFSRRIPTSCQWLPREWRCSRDRTSLSCSTAPSVSNSENFGGWDDLKFFNDWEKTGKFRGLLFSISADDRRYAFMFLLGFMCALSISRVRISSIIALPASFIVFAVGISVGFVMNHMTGRQIKRSSGGDHIRGLADELRNLDCFNALDGKLTDLERSIEKAIDRRVITVSELHGFVKMVELIKSIASSSGKILADSLDGVLDENDKPNRRRKEMDRTRFDFWRFTGLLFGGNSISLKSDKNKNVVPRESSQTAAKRSKGGVSNLFNEKKIKDVLPFPETASNKFGSNKKPMESSLRIAVVPENETKDAADKFEGQYGYHDNHSFFMKDDQISMNMDSYNEIKAYDHLHDSVNFSVSMQRTKTEASFREEQVLRRSSLSRSPYHRREGFESKNHGARHLSEADNQESMEDGEVGSYSSSIVSDDMIFDRHLSEANNLLTKARECLRIGGVEKRQAEIFLHGSLDLLSKAVGMKPMCLLAVGQLGNAYLLLGELKLKISRELRSRLSQSNPSFSEEQVGNERDDTMRSRNKIASALVSVCEECEELLVESGRKYKMALAIDGNDVRALYNWGLALSFRAQLIADIGPEGAFDADKVFMASIDKFDAMMSKTNRHAPDALFRWGVALHQRSLLRPRNSRGKVKLLQQAKRLYEDALQMDMDNSQARDALASCITELNFG